MNSTTDLHKSCSTFQASGYHELNTFFCGGFSTKLLAGDNLIKHPGVLSLLESNTGAGNYNFSPPRCSYKTKVSLQKHPQTQHIQY